MGQSHQHHEAMTFTLTIAFWWIIPFVITTFGIFLWADQREEAKTIFGLWLFLMVVIFLSRFLP